MTVTIGGYGFNGPHDSPSKLSKSGGVYLILYLKEAKYYSCDVGESGNIRERVENHDRKECWKTKCNGTLAYYELLTPGKSQDERMEIEKKVRDSYKFPCGEK